jgi:glycine/D-amino acid oxidase-like deaminating enzyme
MRVLVKGAGVAGLAVAHALASNGFDVDVTDIAPSMGAGASWLAGGMLAPWCERESADERVLTEGKTAADWWEAAAPGEVTRNGTLVVAPPRDQGELARFASRTSGYEWLDGDGIAELEPALAGRFRKGLFFREEAHLDPRRAMLGLYRSLQTWGVRFHFDAAGDSHHFELKQLRRHQDPLWPVGVRRWDRSTGSIPPLLTPHKGGEDSGHAHCLDQGPAEPQVKPLPPVGVRRTGRDEWIDPESWGGVLAGLHCDRIVDCTGSAAIGQLDRLRGVRGEMLMLETADVALSRPIRLLHPRHPIYIVPRQQGRFMVGATMIESAVSGPVTARSLMELLNAAYALHPAFGEARVVETGVGVRPAFPDNFPRVKACGDTIHLNGLYRHGFLLAPAMARQVAAMLAGSSMPTFSTAATMGAMQ